PKVYAMDIPTAAGGQAVEWMYQVTVGEWDGHGGIIPHHLDWVGPWKRSATPTSFAKFAGSTWREPAWLVQGPWQNYYVTIWMLWSDPTTGRYVAHATATPRWIRQTDGSVDRSGYCHPNVPPPG